jgi:heptosyltransferase-2
MKTLIIKLGATGDVVRTTTLLHILRGDVYWLTADKNTELLMTLPILHTCISWSQRKQLFGEYFDMIINLEDTKDAGEIITHLNFNEIYGSYLDATGNINYTESASEWFDISIISRFGKKKADALKSKNRRTYQELIFKGLGNQFKCESYFLPETEKSDLTGDFAIASESGAIWPMKNWAYFDELKSKLETDGYTVNYLPNRDTLHEHIADIKNHKYLISGDSLPMHIALGSEIKCVSIFICTSPWEIYDYGLLKKVISPKLNEYFYRRDFDPAAPKSIGLNEVYEMVRSHIEGDAV